MMMTLRQQLYIALTVLGLINVTTFVQAKSKKKKMKIEAPQPAPTFKITDVNSDTIRISQFKGKKILLSFHRNVGCPICNLRFHELSKESNFFKEHNLIQIDIYESSQENMLTYLDGTTPYSIMIPNPSESLYDLYKIDKSNGKIMKGMFNGAMKKAKEGKKLFPTKMKQDGNMSRIGAEFLIDENGVIHTSYYGKYVGDHLPIEAIKAFIN